MHPSGLLIITSHVSSLCKGDFVSKIIGNARKFVNSTLYVHLNNVGHPEVLSPPSKVKQDANFISSSRGRYYNKTFTADVFSFVTKFYSEASRQCGDIDVNILLQTIGADFPLEPHVIKSKIDCILVDIPDLARTRCSAIAREIAASNYAFKNSDSLDGNENSESPYEQIPVYEIMPSDCNLSVKTKSSTGIIKRNAVVLGGTFDHLHSGHKVLLSEAILLANQKLVIGLSDGPLLQEKTLKELIQPFDLRKRLLEEFIYQVSWHGLQLQIEAIEDPYGPSVTVTDLDVILVSKETIRGGNMVNEKRMSLGMSHLEVHVIGQGTLLDDFGDDVACIPLNQAKTSSSSARFRLLGTLLRPAEKRPIDVITCGQPYYVIGLTGGIAAGKSSIAMRLQKLGAVVIDCDELERKSFAVESRAYQSITDQYGQDLILQADGMVDRRKLHEKMLSDKVAMKSLNDIMWPEIEKACKEGMANYLKNFKYSPRMPIFVLDAALLLETGWYKLVNEVWVANLPYHEAVRRMVVRDGISEERARKLIDSQRPNEWRMERVNVALSTLWEPEVTEKIVEKAWDLLQQRLVTR